MTAMMQKLKILYQSVRQEFCKTPVQSSAALGALLLLLLSIMSSLLPKGFAANRLTKSILIRQEMNLPLTILSVVLLVWAYINLLKPRINKKPSYAFFEFKRVLWKIHNPNDETTIQIEETPYCSKHKAQLVNDDGYLTCPLCRSQSCDSKENHDRDYVKVKSIIMARLHGHIENTSDSTLPK